MSAHANRVKADIARWRAAGLVDDALAARLAADVEQHDRRSISFGFVLAMMAASLLAAAVLLVVAANWEAFPRLGRVAMIGAVILAGYVGGAALKVRGHDAFAEAAWIVAAAGFGGAIALVGQMYHLSGDEKDAVLAWGIGTLVAAAALRSGPLNIGAVLIACGWLTMQVDIFRIAKPPSLVFVLMVAALWAVSLRTRSARARQLLLLAVIFYGFLAYYDSTAAAIPIVMGLAYFGLLAASAQMPDQAQRMLKLGDGGPVLGMLGFLAAIVLLQLEYADDAQFFLIVIVAFVGVVAALFVGGRASRGLRWLAYAGFGFELFVVYVVLVGSMLGTAGFFLVAGIILGLLAWFILRIERRMMTAGAVGGAA